MLGLLPRQTHDELHLRRGEGGRDTRGGRFDDPQTFCLPGIIDIGARV
jgi:hypothetical protein